MATTFSSQAVPSSIAAYVNVVEFSQSRDGLEEMFLNRFLRLEKPRMQDTRTQVVDVSGEKKSKAKAKNLTTVSLLTPSPLCCMKFET